jgi:hypothetical protein
MVAKTTYLARYLAGEYEQVWADLMALGEQVREEPLHADALAVAHETMRRVRANLEALIPRLQRLGYKFGLDWLEPDAQTSVKHPSPPPFTAPGPDVQEQLAELERLADGIPLSIRAWYETIGAVDFVGVPPLHWPLPPWRDGLRRFWEAHPGYSEAIVEQQWRESEAIWSGFEAACQEFIATHARYPAYTQEELWRFAQAHPGFLRQMCSLGTWLDPLQVCSLELQLTNEDLTKRQEEWEAMYGEAPEYPPSLLMSADPLHKYGISGGGPYQIIVPCRAADAPLADEPHTTTFVSYLRLCCRWGGLPGLGDYRTPPREDMAALTRDLLPT